MVCINFWPLLLFPHNTLFAGHRKQGFSQEKWEATLFPRKVRGKERRLKPFKLLLSSLHEPLQTALKFVRVHVASSVCELQFVNHEPAKINCELSIMAYHLSIRNTEAGCFGDLPTWLLLKFSSLADELLMDWSQMQHIATSKGKVNTVCRFVWKTLPSFLYYRCLEAFLSVMLHYSTMLKNNYLLITENKISLLR